MQDAGLVTESFELVPLAGGLNSLRSLANGQTFHPVVGPQKEAETVHVAGTRLVERANALFAKGEFVVWDVGLGAAANALAAVAALQAGYRGGAGVRMLSFDHTRGRTGICHRERGGAGLSRQLSGGTDGATGHRSRGGVAGGRGQAGLAVVPGRFSGAVGPACRVARAARRFL